MMGQFWAMHDALMEGCPPSHPKSFSRLPLNSDWTHTKFAANSQNEETYNAVRADVDGIRTSGVRSTPTFFLNGLLYEGAITTTALTAAIEAALPQTTS